MTLILIVQWIATGVLGLFWLGCASSNFVSLINARIHRSSTSLILLLGGIAGVVAMLVCPIPETTRWAWVPAVLDLGCIPAGLAILFSVFTGKFKDTKKDKETEPTS